MLIESWICSIERRKRTGELAGSCRLRLCKCKISLVIANLAISALSSSVFLLVESRRLNFPNQKQITQPVEALLPRRTPELHSSISPCFTPTGDVNSLVPRWGNSDIDHHLITRNPGCGSLRKIRCGEPARFSGVHKARTRGLVPVAIFLLEHC
jgi:hypothetical protein